MDVDMNNESVYNNNLSFKESTTGTDITLDYDYFKIASIMTTIKAKGLHQSKPVLSLPFLDWFESYDFSEFNFIEFGSGNSTNYFAEKVKNVISFENDLYYFNSIKPNLLDNVDYRFIESDELITKDLNIVIDEKTIVFVDCAANRFLTTKNIFKLGLPNIFILDNSERYKNTCKYIYSKGYAEIPFWGIRLEEPEEACTSVFIKNTFNMIEKNYEYFSAGSIIRKNLPWDTEEPLVYNG
jgi:hypothetical protein